MIDPSKSAKENLETVIGDIEGPGGIITFLNICGDEHEDEAETHSELISDEYYESVSLLQSLGVIENHAYMAGRVERYSWYGEAVSLTAFGAQFVIACDKEIGNLMRSMHEKE